MNGNVSRPIVIPTVPGGVGNPDNELYEASASVELPATDGLEVLSMDDAARKSLEGKKLVTWTIPFQLKNNVAGSANFNLTFNVQLRNKKTGQLSVTPYDLGQETISVDLRIPCTKGHAYLLFGLLFPVSFGMIFLSKKETTLSTTEHHVNAWLVNDQLPLRVNKTYQIGINIGSLRRNAVGGGTFTEPDWGSKTELELLIALNSLDAEVTPEWTTALLPRYGDMEPIFFEVIPKKHENINLSLSIYLKLDCSLLEKFRLRLPTVKAAAAAGR